jgi:manganese transport protein
MVRPVRIKENLRDFRSGRDRPRPEGLQILKFIGPGLLVTVGFIDPGNWASNLAAGAGFGYLLLWMVTLSTVMLIVLQHNVAHLGIATGLCLAEAAATHIRPRYSRLILGSAMGASISTSLAEILGGAIALDMLFGVPLMVGAVLVTAFTAIMLYTNSYRHIERWIIAFVSIIGLSFIYELTLVKIDWGSAALGSIVPSIPTGSLPIVMSVLGAVVMPHNLFLHSEIIQSRQWNLTDETVRKRRLDYEFLDTFFSMIIGWAINSAMIVLAVAAFFSAGIGVTELEQAKRLLEPLLGAKAAVVFAVALLFSGVASTITSGMAAGTISSGFFREPYNIRDRHSLAGVAISLLAGCAIIFFITDPFRGLIISQMVLSIQLPITIFLQIYLTSSDKVMGVYKNSRTTLVLLCLIGAIVTFLNVMLFMSFLK